MAEKIVETAEVEVEVSEWNDGIESVANLEKKILLTVSYLKELTVENGDLRAERVDLQRRVADQNTQLRELRARLARMESERETVKTRVQRLITELDSANPSSREQ